MVQDGVDESLDGVSRETRNRILRFAELFDKWSGTINLVSASTRKDVIRRHVADSLQLLTLAPGPRHWIDLGSGGGFPGVIVAIALAEYGAGWVDLVESNQKKAAFLRVAIAETGARAQIHARRIESMPAVVERCDAISARALADLDGLMAMMQPWFATNPNCTAWLHKGRDYRAEIDKARGRWQFDLVEHASRIEADSVVLEVKRLERS